MSQQPHTQDFAPQPTYTQTTAKNGSWVNVTITKTESDGTVSQTSTIISKRG